MPQHRHSLQACSSYPGKSAALCPKISHAERGQAAEGLLVEVGSAYGASVPIIYTHLQQHSFQLLLPCCISGTRLNSAQPAVHQSGRDARTTTRTFIITTARTRTTVYARSTTSTSRHREESGQEESQIWMR
ncbi:hypothetical protein Q7C36_013248 [Tachysurus vachellii]|uniref:Uncharacterized protein n=1 Tax=Tachysurus vachellii TaxID=175792 RepID=A0AA88MKD4_TACVA|nr:hypothetical protein Q7C36_013248 [Tachysurus vachellii]